MKCRVSVTIEEETLYEIRDLLRQRAFKNKSQFFEKAAKEIIRKGGRHR